VLNILLILKSLAWYDQIPGKYSLYEAALLGKTLQSVFYGDYNFSKCYNYHRSHTKKLHYEIFLTVPLFILPKRFSNRARSPSPLFAFVAMALKITPAVHRT
jgi:hypothetical protein